MSSAAVGLIAGLTVVLALWPGPGLGVRRVSRSGPGQAVGGRAGRVSHRTAGIGVCVVLGLIAGSPLLMSTAPATIWLASARLRTRTARRVVSERNAAVPVMLDSAVQRLQSGSSFSRSVVDALREDSVLGPLPAVKRAVKGIDGGGSVVDEITALAQYNDESGLGEWAPQLAATTAVLLSAGGQGMIALDRLSSTVRANNQAQAEAAAQSGQATASAAVLGVLPLLFACALGAVNGEARDLYFSTWVGAICLGCAVALTSICWALFDRVLAGGGAP